MNRNTLGILLIVIAIGFGFGVLAPKLREVRAIHGDKRAQEEIVKNKTTRLAALQSLKTTFENDKIRVDKLISSLPNVPHLPELIVSVESMGSESGVTINSVIPSDNPTKKQVTVTLVGEGDLGSIEKLAELIAANNRPMSIDSLSISKSSDSSTKKLIFTITVFAPYSGNNAVSATTATST